MSAPSAKKQVIITTVGGKTMTAGEWMQKAKRKAGTFRPSATPLAPAIVPASSKPTLQALDIEAVFDALVVGGSPRGKTWVMNYLKAADHRHARGARLTTDEITQLLQHLAATGRIHHEEGYGYYVGEEAGNARLPTLLAGEHADKLWRWSLWAAGPGYGEPDALPAWVQFRSHDEMAAVTRLLLHGAGLTLASYNRLLNGPLRAAGNRDVVLHALTRPFMPALFDRIDNALRLALIDTIDPLEGNPGTSQLYDWMDTWLERNPAEVPRHLCYRIAEKRMHALDIAGMHAALATQAHTPVHDLFGAADLALAGRWAESAAAFTLAYKALQAGDGVRRGAAPMGITWIYPLVLLAQPTPAAWTAARKFAIAESGSRKPSVHDAWGRWAHAAGVRLGDESLDVGAFAPRRTEHEDLHFGNPVDAAHRLALAAWLDLPADGWNTSIAASLLETLVETRRYWLAKLVVQACAGLKLSDAPFRLKGLDDLPEPAPFLGPMREPWRDALAAITALGDQAPGGKAKTEAATTLLWQLSIDSDGRIEDVLPFERTKGARGWSRPKAITLSRVKKSARLDPRDAAVARSIESERRSAALWLDPVTAVQALVQHPAVSFADAPEQMVELSEGLPALEVRRRSASRPAAKGEGKGNAAAATARPKENPGAGDSFIFRIDPPLTTQHEPRFYKYSGSASYEAMVERQNSVRIVRDAPDRARLIRITPAQRRVAELIAKDWAVPVDAKEELDAALRVLSGLFQLHSDAAAGEEVPGDARLRAQLSPQGDGLHLRLVVMPFGGFGPAVAPGVGRERLMTLHEGLSLTTLRELALERSHWHSVVEALPFLDDGSAPDAGWLLEDPEQALRVIEALPGLPAVAALDWPRGKPLRVVSVDSAALGVQVASGRDWFALQGEVRVDEARVLGLQRVMELARGSRSRFVALGDGEYLALSERLRRQLADLDAAGRTEKDLLKLPLAAAAWLDTTLEGATLGGDKNWQKRIGALAGAAALEPVVEGLHTELRAYQHEGFAWMARLAHAGLGACLADDMGLGKTIQTLALLLRRAADGPALVLAPTSVCANWVAETAKFAPSLSAHLYAEKDDTGRAALVKAAGPYDVIVASYAMAHGENSQLGTRTWGTLVLDEAQALKNAATQRARAVAGLDAGFRLALSGTPVENRLADLWSIMNLINPGLLGTANQFNERFTGPIEKDRDTVTRQRLRRLVSPFLLRRTKSQVLQDLPPRTEIIHRVEPSTEERSFLEALRRSASERVKDLDAKEGDAASSFHVLAELTRLRRAACDPRLVAPELGIVGAKAQAFEQIVRELVDGQHKALVFSQFTGFLKLLAERLDSCGIAYQYLDGATPAAERAKHVLAFQRGEGEVFLISLKAGGFGLNLTAADYVLIVDPWWNPAAEDQAMGRAHRIGQERPVTVYRLVTAGSIEERIIELHHDKRSLADGILEGQEDATPISAQVLRELLLEGD